MAHYARIEVGVEVASEVQNTGKASEKSLFAPGGLQWTFITSGKHSPALITPRSNESHIREGCR